MSVRITDIREVTKPIASPIRNAYIDFTTIDAFVGMNDEHVFAFVKTIDGAHLHAVHKLALDARFIDNIGQMSSPPSGRVAYQISSYWFSLGVHLANPAKWTITL